MKLLVLTGGIGMGKSTAAAALQALGVPVMDTDDLARQVVEPGQPALNEIARRFGAAFVGSDGQLRREALAHSVFADATARRALEEIIHPRIRNLWLAQVEQWQKESRPVGVIVIPLLYENGLSAHFQAVICVVCSVATQQRRLLARGWSPEQDQQRLQAQWPPAKKAALADFVVWAEGVVEAHAAQVRRIITPFLLS
jgi:dephospho-CoA kinase